MTTNQLTITPALLSSLKQYRALSERQDQSENPSFWEPALQYIMIELCSELDCEMTLQGVAE